MPTVTIIMKRSLMADRLWGPRGWCWKTILNDGTFTWKSPSESLTLQNSQRSCRPKSCHFSSISVGTNVRDRQEYANGMGKRWFFSDHKKRGAGLHYWQNLIESEEWRPQVLLPGIRFIDWGQEKNNAASPGAIGLSGNNCKLKEKGSLLGEARPEISFCVCLMAIIKK